MFVYEQGPLVLLDPTNFVVKNVTPNCYKITEILAYLKNIRDCIDGFKKSWLEELRMLGRKASGEDPEKVLSQRVKERFNGARGWVEKLFNLQRVKAPQSRVPADWER